MLIIILVGLFILGACFGSFGSVLMLRLEKKCDWKTVKSLLRGFSECPSCKKRLTAKHLIPIFSYFQQKGKCSFCKKNISSLYVTLEIGSGSIFVLSYLFAFYLLPTWGILPHWGIAIFWMAVNWLLFLLIVHDFKTYELHVPLWILGLVIILVPQFFTIIGNYKQAFWGSLVFGGLFYGLYYWAQWYLKLKYKKKQEWIWEWDAYLAFAIGALIPLVLQYHYIPFSWIVLVSMFFLFIILSGFVGIIHAIILLLISRYLKIWKKHKKSINFIKVPFIPAMIVAFWILLIWANSFIWLVLPHLW